MKIRALRVAQFRRFAEPAALEGFEDGVNVLSGANESGKSTLFAALEAVFLVPHTKTGAGLEAMRPRGGGEPLIEAEFETGGRRYLIRKQYGRGKSATLSDLDAGMVVARAGEAEARLAQFVGASGDVVGRAGLVWVHQQRALVAPDPDLDPETGKLRARGERDALARVLSDEVLEAAGSHAAEEVIARVRGALDVYVTASRGGAKKDGPYDKALKELSAAREAVARAQSAAASSETRLKRIAELSAAIEGEAAKAHQADLSRRVGECERRLEEAKSLRVRRDELAAKSEMLQLAADNARQALAAAEGGAARRSELSARLGEAQDLERAIASLAADLNGDQATPARLNHLVEIERAVAVAEASAIAGKTYIDLALLATAAGKVTANGVPAACDEKYAVSEALTLDIEGIGTIRVTAADAEKVRALRRRREEDETRLRDILVLIGARSIEDARARGERRQARARELETMRVRLAATAPQGASSLAQELQRVDQPGGDLAQLRAHAEDAAFAASAARRAFEAARCDAPDDMAVRKLASQWDDAQKASRALAERRERMALERAKLSGEQENFDEEGQAGEADEAAGRLQRANGEVARIEDEIAALRMLLSTLESTVANVKSHYLKPVTRAIAPYLSRLFPTASIGLEDGFALKAIARGEGEEEFSTLSDGTREQLSVLVRMGFARVLAERGECVPLVLDDPLVYSDDERLAAMCHALEEAAQSFQIVVLTCRETAFQKLSGRRLTLVNWRPEV